MSDEWIPMPGDIPMSEAGPNNHDMLVGPCGCGAWHSLDDWEENMRLTADEIQLILEALREKRVRLRAFGREIGRFHAKLSIMLEVAVQVDEAAKRA